MPIMTSNKFKVFIVDIETKPNENLEEMFFEQIKAPTNIKDEEKIKANIEGQKKGAKKDMAIDIDYSDIICIGVKEVGGESNQITLEEFDLLLTEIYANQDKLVTYNGKTFDLPILIRALLKKGLTTNVKFLKELCKKYNAYGHIDLIEELNNYAKYKSLDELCRIYVGGGKEHIDFKIATEEEIKKHNLECLDTTEKLYKFFEPIL